MPRAGRNYPNQLQREEGMAIEVGDRLTDAKYPMLVDDGVVKSINVDEPGKFEMSSGDALLAQI
jgi:peroxiredoxin